MPFALVIIGLLMIVTGARDTYAQFGAAIKRDFTGPGNFTFWLVSLGAVGAVGYIDKLRPLSRAFLVLILVAMVLSNRGVFAKLSEALQRGPISPRPSTPEGEAAAPSVPGSGPFGLIPNDLIPRWIWDPNPFHWISPNFGDVMPNDTPLLPGPANPMQRDENR